jgi:hypothetical protein
MLDYTLLKLIWWLLVCVLLIGFAIMDGHDMGVGTLLPSSVAMMMNVVSLSIRSDHIGMVIRSGLLPLAARSLPHGHWSMQQHFPGFILP